jgi:Na+/proline symporter
VDDYSEKIIRISRVNKISSIADFISRYGNSRFLGALVTIVCISEFYPTFPQLKSISDTFILLQKHKQVQIFY